LTLDAEVVEAVVVVDVVLSVSGSGAVVVEVLVGISDETSSLVEIMVSGEDSVLIVSVLKSKY